MTVSPSPTVQRRRLGTELRRLREAAGLTIDKVAEALECSDSKVSRIENGQVSATPRDVRDMLVLYGISGTQKDDLIQIAREARLKGWWHSYGDVLLSPYVGFEAAALEIRYYGALLIPGLLQTEQYARSVVSKVYPQADPTEVERQVKLRMTRQEILTRDDPPLFSVVLDEAVVHRLVGSREIMRDQLRYLVQAAAHPSVVLQVLPFEKGEHAAMDGAFTLLHFPETLDPDLVFFETPTRTELYSDDPNAVKYCRLAFESIRDMALKPEESKSLLKKLTKELQLPNE